MNPTKKFIEVYGFTANFMGKALFMLESVVELN